MVSFKLHTLSASTSFLTSKFQIASQPRLSAASQTSGVSDTQLKIPLVIVTLPTVGILTLLRCFTRFLLLHSHLESLLPPVTP